MSDNMERIIQSGDTRKIIRTALNARIQADNGVWCECAEPSTHGLDLMCGTCLLNSKEQEIKKLHAMVDVHDFESPTNKSGFLRSRMCVHCSFWEDDPRHHGTPAVGTTSWGTKVQGLS